MLPSTYSITRGAISVARAHSTIDSKYLVFTTSSFTPRPLSLSLAFCKTSNLTNNMLLCKRQLHVKDVSGVRPLRHEAGFQIRFPIGAPRKMNFYVCRHTNTRLRL